MTDKPSAPTLQDVVARFAESAERLDQLSEAAGNLEDEAARQSTAVRSLEEVRAESARVVEVLGSTASELKAVVGDMRSLTQAVNNLIEASDNSVVIERINSIESLCKTISDSAQREADLRDRAMSKMSEEVSAKIDAVFATLPNRWKK